MRVPQLLGIHTLYISLVLIGFKPKTFRLTVILAAISQPRLIKAHHLRSLPRTTKCAAK